MAEPLRCGGQKDVLVLQKTNISCISFDFRCSGIPIPRNAGAELAPKVPVPIQHSTGTFLVPVPVPVAVPVSLNRHPRCRCRFESAGAGQAQPAPELPVPAVSAPTSVFSEYVPALKCRC